MFFSTVSYIFELSFDYLFRAISPYGIYYEITTFLKSKLTLTFDHFSQIQQLQPSTQLLAPGMS